MVHHRNWIILAVVIFTLIAFIPSAQPGPPLKEGNPGLPGCLAEVNQLEQITVNQNLTILGLQKQIKDLQDAMKNYAPVPVTGQAGSYYSGDDGDLQRGVKFPVPRFTNNGNGTVTDNLTRLIWLQKANCGGPYVWPYLPDFPMALAQVEELNAAGTMNTYNCGDTSNQGSHQTDWRLPNIKELLSLLDYAFQLPALSNTAGTDRWVEGDPFTGVQLIPFYHSSTRGVECPTCNWGVWFGDGASAFPVLGYVWPVRGGE
jgi:hypothetical protein